MPAAHQAHPIAMLAGSHGGAWDHYIVPPLLSILGHIPGQHPIYRRTSVQFNWNESGWLMSAHF